MKGRRIGGRPVGAIGLGGAAWSLDTRVDQAAVSGLIHSALDLGVTLLDTARAYTTLDHRSHNEDLIRRALAGHPRRDDVLVATKGGHYRSGLSDFPIDGRPASLRAHCYDSLRHLGVERIGLYFLHHPDPSVPIEQSVETLASLQAEGAIEMIGVSNVNQAQLAGARSVAAISAVQNSFSPWRVTDRAMIGELNADGISYLMYSPLGGSRRPTAAAGTLPTIRRLAKERGVSTARITLAWELAAAPNVVPIVGASTLATLADSAAAASLTLTSDQVARIDFEADQVAVLPELGGEGK